MDRRVATLCSYGDRVEAPSLRERSKVRRREAIQRSAVRLFAERGYDGATIADIAEDAEVAPRTVSMYFSSKLDLAMSTSSDIAERLTAVISTHPELSFTEAVDRWLTGEAASLDPELAELTAAMFDANPGLRTFSGTYIAESARVAMPVFVAQLGLAPDDPLVPIVGAAVSGALTAYVATAQRSTVAPEVHQSFMRYLRAIIEAARPT